MTKILFVAQNFEMGGVQRALANMLSEISQIPGYSITVFSFGKGPLLSFMPGNIKVVSGRKLLRLVATPMSQVLKSKNFIDILLRVVLTVCVRLIGSEKFYRILLDRQPKLGAFDVAVSYFNDVPDNYFNQGTNQYVDRYMEAERKFAWFHTDPIAGRYCAKKCSEAYRNFDRVVCVSKGIKDKMEALAPSLKNKTTVVYNFYPVTQIINEARSFMPYSNSGCIRLITVGRIDNVCKNFDLIPKLAKKLLDENCSRFEWYIVGDGPDLEKCRKRVLEYGVSECVYFVGEKENPYPYVYYADLFVFPTKYEGFPMVVGEALALGTPVVVSNYAAAVEQVAPNAGVICDTGFEDMAKKLVALLNNISMIEEMKVCLKKNKFDNHKALEQLQAVINQSD